MAHPIAQLIAEQMKAQETNIFGLGDRAGVHPDTIWRWIHQARDMRLSNLEAVLDVLGYQLRVERKPE